MEAIAVTARRAFYPENQPFNRGRLRVSPIHEIYFEECGNPSGNTDKAHGYRLGNKFSFFIIDGGIIFFFKKIFKNENFH